MSPLTIMFTFYAFDSGIRKDGTLHRIRNTAIDGVDELFDNRNGWVCASVCNS
jgi:hypothetical protein